MSTRPPSLLLFPYPKMWTLSPTSLSQNKLKIKDDQKMANLHDKMIESEDYST